jgi:6-phosphogluconate dehydrogenase
VPALSAALGYFDAFRQARGTANLIQGQRDYFGAHGFERTDAEGLHHGPWDTSG